MKTNAERQLDYRTKLKNAGLERLHCWIEADTRVALRDIAEREGKTIGEVINLGMLLARQHFKGIPHADQQPAKRPVIITKPIAEAAAPQKRLLAHDQTADNTSTPPPPENEPTAPQRTPEQPADGDVDALIRAAAFVEH